MKYDSEGNRIFDMQAPCLDCSDRHPLCHADCRRYAEYKKELEEAKAVAAAKKAVYELGRPLGKKRVRR